MRNDPAPIGPLACAQACSCIDQRRKHEAPSHATGVTSRQDPYSAYGRSVRCMFRNLLWLRELPQNGHSQCTMPARHARLSVGRSLRPCHLTLCRTGQDATRVHVQSLVIPAYQPRFARSSPSLRRRAWHDAGGNRCPRTATQQACQRQGPPRRGSLGSCRYAPSVLPGGYSLIVPGAAASTSALLCTLLPADGQHVTHRMVP